MVTFAATLLTIAVIPCLAINYGKIAFVRGYGTNSEIYTMNADGTQPINLTKNAAGDATPAFSPDGTKIVFSSDMSGSWAIYVMNAYDGTELTLLTNNFADSNPAFSSDGTKIVFTRSVGYYSSIYLMNADGTGQTQITSGSYDYAPSFSHDGRGIVFNRGGDIYFLSISSGKLKPLTRNAAAYDPVISPDGTKIAFVSNRDGNDEIYKMNFDGSNVQRLTINTAVDRQPAFSADGQKIVFWSDRKGYADYEIYTMNTDGDYQIPLTDTNAWNTDPAWAMPVPNRPKIAFSSDRDGYSEIYTMNPDGSNLRRLTFNLAGNRTPEWSPDGTLIAFRRDFIGICTMKADGTNQTCFTSGDRRYNEFYPDWSPDGSRIVCAMGNLFRFLDAQTGTVLREFPEWNGNLIDGTAWSPDGQWILFGHNGAFGVPSGGISITSPSGTVFSYFHQTSPRVIAAPEWSPDGKKIVFRNYGTQNLDIYTYDYFNWGSPIRITNNPANDYEPEFTTDNRIIFATDRDGNSEIYVMGTDGSNPIRLTSNPANDTSPSWRP